MPFESVLAGDVRAERKRRVTLVAAALFHAALLVTAALRSVWDVDEVEPPRLAIVFGPLAATPAPPPTERASSRAQPPGGPRPRHKSTLTERRSAVQPPAEVPQTTEKTTPETHEPSAARPATAPGTDGPDGTRGPSMQRTNDNRDGTGGGGPGPGDHPGGGAPKLAPPQVGEKHCLACPPPHVPPTMLRVSGDLTLLVKICVRADGIVDRVSVLRGISAEVDARARATIESWRFQPMSVNGRPVPFCYVTRFSFTLAP